MHRVLRHLPILAASLVLELPAAARQVTNGSFETGAIPTSISQITNAVPWTNANAASTDYFAVGGTGGAGVPTNFFGSTAPRTGNAYAGIHTYASNTSVPGYLFREYLQSPLTATLSPGSTYLVSFWTRRADGIDSVLATNRLGVKLSAATLSQGDVGNLTALPDYEYPVVITSATTWEHVVFPFVSAGTEQNLVIGNFRDNAGTTVQVMGTPPGTLSRGYYYVDDVSIVECSTLANGGFEVGVVPTSISQITNAIPWTNANGGSSDYFAVGGTGGAGVPANMFGSRTPHGGNAYAGIHTYASNTTVPGYLFREYLQAPLDAPLSAESTYLVEFWVCRAAGPDSVLATDKMGVKLSSTSVSQAGVGDLTLVPDFEHPGVVTDEVNWTRIAFLYRSASGGEQYVVIGNFNDNAGTTVQVMGTPPGDLSRGYYYVDDVSLQCVSEVRATSEPCSVSDGVNQDVLSAPPVVIGQSWNASIAVGHPHGAMGSFTVKLKSSCCNGPTVTSPVGGRQVKFLTCGPELSSFAGSHNGTSGSTSSISVPVSISLVGVPWAAQAVVIGGGFADLSTAITGVIGTY